MNDITFRFGPSFLSHLGVLPRHTRIKPKGMMTDAKI